MAVETQAFYHPLPRYGTPLNQQWDEFREDFNALAPLVRAAEVDIAELSGSHDLAFFDYGKLDFRNKWRAGYNRTLEGYVIQWNSATEASPTWSDVVLIRDADRRVVVRGAGGFESETGFYNLGNFLDSFYLVVRGSLRQKKVFPNREAGLVFDSVFFYLDNLSNPDEVLVTLTPSGSGGETNTASNLGAGEGVFANKLGVDLRFKSFTGTSPITVSSTGTEINVATSAEANTASNLGSGEGWFSAKSGVDLQFKSAVAGEGIAFSSTATEVQIRSTVGKFYGVFFRESEAGGRVERDDTLVFDSTSGFYLTQAGNDGKPLLSFEDHVTSVAASSSGDETLVASDTATGAGHAVLLKRLTAGANITLSSDANAVTITGTSSAGGAGFYGVVFKESEAGGRIERDDTLVVDSTSGFYLTQAGNDGKPLLSLHDHVTQVGDSGSGDETLVASDTATGAGHAVLLKRLTQGSNITFTVDGNQISIASTGSGFYGVVFKESEAGGRVERDDTIVFDSSYFYLTQAGNDGKPLLSAHDAIITFQESEAGGFSKASSRVKFDSDDFYVTTSGGGAPLVSIREGAGAQREVLLAARTYYVRSDGSNNNSGLVNSASGAFLTLQKAADTIGSLDLGIYTATIQIGTAATYAGATFDGRHVGGFGSSVQLRGDTASPGSYVISSVITVKNGAALTLSGIDFTTSSDGLVADKAASVVIDGATIFGVCTDSHMVAKNQGNIEVTSNYTVDGGTGNSHMRVDLGGSWLGNSITVTVSGTPNITYFAVGADAASLRAQGNTYSGSATGTRYYISGNAVVNTNLAGANYFPGDVAGSTATGGQYN